MSFDDLQSVWRSPHNRPNAARLEEQKMKFTADLQRRRRGFRFFLVSVFAVLALTTGRLIVFAFTTGSAGGGVDFGREWGAVPFLLLPWIAAVGFAVAYRRHRARHPDHDRSLAAGVRALLDDNRLTRGRYKAVAWLHGAMLLLVPLVVFQLRAVGKAGHEIVVPAFVLWPLLLASILGAMRWHYRRRLVPRQRELEALLREYEQG